MATNAQLPLSETVIAVFSEFLNKIKEEKILDEAAVAKLREALGRQKFDHETLRDALFGVEKDPS